MRKHSARIGLRLRPSEREKIAIAAVVDDRSISGFVREAAVEKAEQVWSERQQEDAEEPVGAD